MTVPPSASRLTSQDFYNEDTGGVYLDNGGVFTDGNGNLYATTYQSFGNLGTVQTLVTGNTITLGNNGACRVTAAAAVTGIILPLGGRPYQQFIVIHEGAAGNTITFAAAGTSNVADGASAVITGPSQKMFVWDSVTNLWYHN